MANYFLASVGNAELFKSVNGNLQHVATAKTLTDSTINFSSTAEEVRGGQGAKLYGRFNHDSGMALTLTDAMFKLEYLAMQTGSNLIDGVGASAMRTDQVTVGADGNVTLTATPVAFGQSCGLDHTVVWYRPAGCDAKEDYTMLEVDGSSATISVGTALEGQTLCVSYFANEAGARSMLVSANFIPAELILFLTAQLFAGDASAPETGRPVGYITVKIPRFSLDGTFDLSMAMSAAATISITGTALAVDDGSCDSEGVYAEIVEVITGKGQYDNLYALAIDNDTRTVAEMGEDDSIVTYGYFTGATPIEMNTADLVYTCEPSTMSVANGVVTNAAAGTITVAVNGLTNSPEAVLTIEA